LPLPAAATASQGNRLLAKGTVSEVVPGGDWQVQFAIHARGNGQSSFVTVQNPAQTFGFQSFSFDGTLCAGTYTDPTLGGTTVYVVGAQTSYTGAGGRNLPYYGFKVHEGGPLGADSAWVDVYFTSLSVALDGCASPASTLSGKYFSLDAANVHFRR
jgi:hypothetical protein